ncbi:DNA repair protein RecN [bacterium AH-315-J21]|nr:DNA repair protein RecN [bacterium AH-315-J21]
MLKTLQIQNLAVIERVAIDFSAGLTVITGESGAGKSLLIRALALALGARADRDDCGSFATTTSIETDFSVSPAILPALEHLEITVESSSAANVSVTLRRELTASGRSRCFINDQLVRLSDLSDIATRLCEISGQSSSVALRDPMRQLAMLDQFAGLTKTVIELGELYDTWMNARAALRKLERSRDEISRERQLLKFQLEELQKADLSISEEGELISEKKRLDDFERLSHTCNLILTTLESDESPLETLQALRGAFSEVKNIDERFSEHNDLFDSSLIQLEEVLRNVATFHSALQFDAERLETINQRLSEIYQLKNKYGGTVANALDELTRITKHLESLPDPQEAIDDLLAQANVAGEHYSQLALKVRDKRQQSATALTKTTVKEFTALALEKAQFKFVFEEQFIFEDKNGEPTISITIDGQNKSLKAQRLGLESGTFYFSANPGEEPRPLARVASGGELSRVLLALKIATRNKANKTAASKGDHSPVAVFDEIDTGVSGATATAMGKKLKELSASEQTIVVTHLRQVVEQADNHLLVEKAPTKGKNTVSVISLNKQDSKREQLKMVDLEPAAQ